MNSNISFYVGVNINSEQIQGIKIIATWWWEVQDNGENLQWLFQRLFVPNEQYEQQCILNILVWWWVFIFIFYTCWYLRILLISAYLRADLVFHNSFGALLCQYLLLWIPSWCVFFLIVSRTFHFNNSHCLNELYLKWLDKFPQVFIF